MLVYGMGTPPGYFWKEMDIHPVFENGDQSVILQVSLVPPQ